MNYPNSKTVPWNHQVEALNEAIKYKGYMIAHGMGAGKSKTAVDFAVEVGAKSILILCPKTVVDVWPVQFDRHSFVDRKIYLLNIGSVTKRAESLRNFREGAVIINYDAAWRPPLGPVFGEKNRLLDPGFLLSQKWDLVIMDESHRIKSPGGKASWFCKKLRDRAKYVLGLTGTPMPHSPLDIYAQMRAIDPALFGTSFLFFKRRYAVMGGFGGKQTVAFQNLEELHAKLFTRMHRVETKDVVDLPESFHETRTFDLCPKARKVYQDLKLELKAEFDRGEITASNALVKLLRLQQITGGQARLDDGNSIIIDTGKQELLIDLLSDLPEHEPVVVFCVFQHDLDVVHEAAKALCRASSELSGRVNNLSDWQAGQSDILAVQIRAGGLGVDLTRSHYCVYYSLGFSLGDYEQSEARELRPGQKSTVFYYHLVASKTVDETVYKALQAKKNVVESVLGEWT